MTQPVKFGFNVDPNTGGLPIAERITAIADASGLDLAGIQDHPDNDGFTDTLALITWLAATGAPTIKHQASGRVPVPHTTSGCGSAS